MIAVHRRLVYGGSKAPTGSTGKLDFISYYNNILGHPHGEEVAGSIVADNTIQWVIPNFGFGSGGHLNIFRFINMLAARGSSSVW